MSTRRVRSSVGVATVMVSMLDVRVPVVVGMAGSIVMSCMWIKEKSDG